MQFHHQTPGPPPARDQGTAAAMVQSMRLRRSSVPSNSSPSYRNLHAAETAAFKSEDAREADPIPPSHSTSRAAPKQPKAESQGVSRSTAARANAGAMTRKDTRQGSLFSSQEKKRDQNETSEVISSLQQNAVALTALNQRERAHNEQLKAQVEQLLAELSKAKGTAYRKRGYFQSSY